MHRGLAALQRADNAERLLGHTGPTFRGKLGQRCIMACHTPVANLGPEYPPTWSSSSSSVLREPASSFTSRNFTDSWLSKSRRNKTFQLRSDCRPAGDQPQAIKAILQEFQHPAAHSSRRKVTLDGATGTGKTFVMAHVISQLACPTLILSPSKVLAQQQYAELKELFPNAPLHLFQSAFEAFPTRSIHPDTGELLDYGARTIDKSAWRGRHQAIDCLRKKKDVIVIATVAALFACSPPQQHRLEPHHIDLLCKRMRKALARRLREMSCSVRQERLRNMVEGDIRELTAFGRCTDMFEKYGKLLPENLERMSLIESFNATYGQRAWMAVLDESHHTLRAVDCVNEDRERRLGQLEEEGFQLPGAADHPLSRGDFEKALPNRVLYASATPALFELWEDAPRIVKMVVRPNHIVDPKIELVAKTGIGALRHLAEQISRLPPGSQVLLNGTNHRIVARAFAFLESQLPSIRGKMGHMRYTLSRQQRYNLMHKFNTSKELQVLGGVGMLAEGLSFRSVSLVVVLDADSVSSKFRTEEKLTQMAGRATRSENARVIFYHRGNDPHSCFAIRRCVQKCEERRQRQLEFNQQMGVKPRCTDVANGIAWN